MRREFIIKTVCADELGIVEIWRPIEPDPEPLQPHPNPLSPGNEWR